MQTRRNFLKGLLASVAAGALIKNGILQPEQIIAEPRRRVFDMAANTWRDKAPILAAFSECTISMSLARTFKDVPMPKVGDLVGVTFTQGGLPVILGCVSHISESGKEAWISLQSPTISTGPIWTLK